MTILIANIGTSDLAIKIDDYYFPVGFDRSEPNIEIDDSGLTPNERIVWERDQREGFIKEFLCPELGVPVEKGRFSFRELTRKLLEAYQQDEETWHQRIRPGRIWGVVKAAQEPRFQVKEAYIFVTDQPETEKKGYPSDTVHLFDILEKWFKREVPKLKLKKTIIPENIAAVKQDELLNYYYQFFLNEISSDEVILISIKGGTPQMQTALKMQAIASGISKQVFVEPKLSIKRILAGEESECPLTSYWRYMRSQRYQAVELLLETRWDFDGTRQILQEWSKVLKFLLKEKVTDVETVSQSNQILEQVIKTLELGVDYLNLDYDSAKQLLQENPQLKVFTGVDGLVTKQGDEKLLNLYTQCRMYWDINQIANLLSRMSSFYEETLYRLVSVLDGEKYFTDTWRLDTALVRQEIGESLWESFLNEEKRTDKEYNSPKRSYDFNQNPLFKLEGRFTKRNFIEMLASRRQVPSAQWQIIINSLKSLDFWMTQRNNLIHSAEGVSKKRMQELLDWDRQRHRSKASHTCESAQIRGVMGAICSSDLGLVRMEYQQKFVGNKAAFYLYSDIANSVLKQLHEESSR